MNLPALLSLLFAASFLGRAFGWRTMDALFLMLVRAYPQAAPDLFVALFCNTKPQSVIRFLSDRASLADYLRVVAALFPGPLLRALLGRWLSCNQAAELLKVQ